MRIDYANPFMVIWNGSIVTDGPVTQSVQQVPSGVNKMFQNADFLVVKNVRLSVDLERGGLFYGIDPYQSWFAVDINYSRKLQQFNMSTGAWVTTSSYSFAQGLYGDELILPGGAISGITTTFYMPFEPAFVAGDTRFFALHFSLFAGFMDGDINDGRGFSERFTPDVLPQKKLSR